MKEDLPADEVSAENTEQTQAERKQEPDMSSFTKSSEPEKPHL